MGIIDDYTSAGYDEQRFYAAYPPYDKLRLGDYGELEGRIFRSRGNLGDLPRSSAAR